MVPSQAVRTGPPPLPPGFRESSTVSAEPPPLPDRLPPPNDDVTIPDDRDDPRLDDPTVFDDLPRRSARGAGRTRRPAGPLQAQRRHAIFPDRAWPAHLPGRALAHPHRQWPGRDQRRPAARPAGRLRGGRAAELVWRAQSRPAPGRVRPRHALYPWFENRDHSLDRHRFRLAGHHRPLHQLHLHRHHARLHDSAQERQTPCLSGQVPARERARRNDPARGNRGPVAANDRRLPAQANASCSARSAWTGTA